MSISNPELNLKFSLCAVNGRNQLGLTQEEAAESLHISLRGLQLIEKAVRLPNFEVALRMSKLYNIDLNLFLDKVTLAAPMTRSNQSKEDRTHVSLSSR